MVLNAIALWVKRAAARQQGLEWATFSMALVILSQRNNAQTLLSRAGAAISDKKDALATENGLRARPLC